MAKSLGMNAFRISLEWSRIEPQRGEWDENALFHYREMIGSMKKRGLTPIVTLNHLTLPTWVLLPPSRFEKKAYQFFLPIPFRDLPLGDPVSDDLFWKSTCWREKIGAFQCMKTKNGIVTSKGSSNLKVPEIGDII